MTILSAVSVEYLKSQRFSLLLDKKFCCETANELDGKEMSCGYVGVDSSSVVWASKVRRKISLSLNKK